MSQMTPYGYRIVRGEAIIDSEEALNLRTFFKLFLQGFTVEDARHDAGIKMSLAAVGMMLSNRTYLGDGFYPRIIDEETFEAAQTERAKRNRRPEGLNSCRLFPVPVASRFRFILPPPTASLENSSAPAASLVVTAAELFSALYSRVEPAQKGGAATMPAQDARRIQQMFTNTQHDRI